MHNTQGRDVQALLQDRLLLSALHCAADYVLQLMHCEAVDLANQVHQKERDQSSLLSAM